jgi:hypothetical protein
MSKREASVTLTASDDFYCRLITHLEDRPDLHATPAYLSLITRLLPMQLDPQEWPELAKAKSELQAADAENICGPEVSTLQ